MKYAQRSRTSLPGDRRKNFFGGSSMKSSRSMYSTRENGTLRVPADAIFRVVDDVDLLDLPLRVVRDDDLQRTQHGHHARRAAVQILADAVLELRHVDDVFLLRDADARAEVADRLRRVAAAPQAADRRHPRIVPARHVALLHELQQLALAHHRVVQVQPRELDLLRPVAVECRLSTSQS